MKVSSEGRERAGTHLLGRQGDGCCANYNYGVQWSNVMARALVRVESTTSSMATAVW